MIFTILDGRHQLYQYDTDVLLKINLEEGESCDRVHFTSGSNSAYVVSPYIDPQHGLVARVADESLQKGANLTVFAWIKNPYNPELSVDESGQTYVKEQIKVIPRSKPATYVYTPSGKMTWEEWVKESKNWAEESQASAELAEQYKNVALEFRNETESLKGETEEIRDEVVALKGEVERFAEQSEADIEGVAEAKKSELNAEATRLMGAFDENAMVKTAGFNQNASEKKTELDSIVNTAESSMASSVQIASNKATEASNSAQSASASASSASSSASSASASATSASGSASSASTSARNASTSEANAKTYRDEAETAKNTATGLVNGFDAKVTSAKSEIEAKGAEVIASIPEDYTELVSKVGDVKKDLTHKANVDDLMLANRKIKALYDVLNGIDLKFETNEYNSAKVDVPSGAVADSVLKIGGKSVVWNQIQKSALYNSSQSGISWQKNADGAIVFNGTATSDISVDVGRVDYKGGHKYLLCGIPSGASSNGWHIGWFGGNNFVRNSIVSVNADDYWTTRFKVKSGTVMNNVAVFFCTVDLTQMFGDGNEPTSVDDPRIKAIEEYAELHPEYNEGEIFSSQTDALEVRGKNLFDPRKTSNYLISASGVESTNNNYRLSEFIEVKSVLAISGTKLLSDAFRVIFYNQDKDFKSRNDVSSLPQRVTPTQASFIRINYNYGHWDENTIQVEVGSSPTPYESGVPLTIPTNLPVLRSAGNVHDEIVDGKLIQRVGVVDLGTLEWTYDGNNKFITRTNFGQIGGHNYFSDLYYYSSTIWGTSGDTGTSAFGTSREFHARHNSYTDATAFKTAMNGVMLLYELAEPIITDIDPLPQLEAINVESGGQLTFVDHSELAMPIPTTHEWVVRNEEV